ncbi:alpha/beta-hydrolase [Delitschia confertaspora ATCC 74209]|uniref:Alpha/beta-hydrolase n=1 Tax=Delitschia confertaspora ATCC 74209 TaxID=1513339 RepID=A0A9P4JKR6_9PLEO|nr:alpha/beta-hydrolase [Delitschia confertaspora ATCC 74209]
MHVSSKYLELTRNKLQLTRLPREPRVEESRSWELGTPKQVLEGLLDYWLESYDWRAQETLFNNKLPQFRTTIQVPTASSGGASLPIGATSPPYSSKSNGPRPTEFLRIHLTHTPSKHPNTIPLLLCCAYPSSFIEIQKIISALTDPHSLPSYGAGAQQAFHVVAVSVPGCGFSDASEDAEFGLKGTADIFQSVMENLGYQQGFQICRALALYHPEHVLAIHTSNPVFREPALKKHPGAWLKYQVARLTRARIGCLSFGYVPFDFESTHPAKKTVPVPSWSGSISDEESAIETLPGHHYTFRPHTHAYTLCDSPVGLLATIIDSIHTRSMPSPSTVSAPTSATRSHSPFLSPSELELQESDILSTIEEATEDSPVTAHSDGSVSPQESEINARDYVWTPTEVLNWTMLHWLPGPEAALRWLTRAKIETETPGAYMAETYSKIPLGISEFRTKNRGRGERSPLMWGVTLHKIDWIKRHNRSARFPAWEAPDLLVLDLREFFGGLVERGVIGAPTGRKEANGVA